MDYKRISSTALSSDGSLVAYTVSEPKMEGTESTYLTHIRLAATDGSWDKQMTRGDKSCYSPAFSPDSRFLSFRSARDGSTMIWLMPLDGGEAFSVTESGKSAGSYKWSPDGSMIAFLMSDPETADEKQQRDEKRDMSLRDHGWQMNHIHYIEIDYVGDASKAKRLTEGDFNVTSFDWSPDCEAIAYAHRPTPSPDTWRSADISLVSLVSGRSRKLISREGSDRYPFWSPDGSLIAFPSDHDDPHWALLADMYIIPPEGGSPKRLADTPDRNFMYYGSVIGWASDSSALFVREASRTSWRVFRIPLDGGKPEKLTAGPGNWSYVSMSRDGRTMAFVHETSDTVPNLFVTSTDRYAPRQLTDLNPDLNNSPVAKTETLTWKSKNGFEIEGLLTYPADYVEGRRYPMILYMHGGPASVHTESYIGAANKYPIQAFADAGYAVLRTNPRGSSGYGKEFRYANIKDWGFGDFNDQMAGVDAVIDMGVAHPDSLCVSGWSYGGFMTAMTVTKTDRFKAAVMGAGISDLASFSGTCDIPSFIPDYFGGEAWEETKRYIKHSPVYHVDGVTTPTLVLHGSLDRRVPLSQGEEFYNALNREGCKTDLVVYPRSYHSPSEPKFVEDIGRRIIDWFDSNLGR